MTLVPTVPALFDAHHDGRLAAPVRVSDRLGIIPLPVPTPGVVQSTLCYALIDDDGRAHLVDPGWDLDENLARVRGALAEWHAGEIAQVIATHLHPDHLGLAVRLQREVGARLVLGRAEAAALAEVADRFAGAAARLAAWGVPEERMPTIGHRGPPRGAAPVPDLLLGDGDRLDIPGWDLRAVHTPGHTAGHLCFADESAGVLLTGDHVLPVVHPGIGLGGDLGPDPIGTYLASLRRLLEWEAAEVLPGHEYPFRGLAERVAQITAHHERRAAEIGAAREAEPGATVWRLASRATWTAGFDNLHDIYLYSALSQTEWYLAYLDGR